jgi:hypothetical protein
MRKFVKMALASSLAAGLGISAALANETQISITLLYIGPDGPPAKTDFGFIVLFSSYIC